MYTVYALIVLFNTHNTAIRRRRGVRNMMFNLPNSTGHNDHYAQVVGPRTGVCQHTRLTAHRHCPLIYDTTVMSSPHHTRHTDRRLPLLVCTPRGPTSYTQRTSPTSRQVWSFRNLRHTRCTCIRYLPATTNLSLIHGRISDANISISHRNTSIYCVI